jgi:small-conductance mechanosensitive channel
MTDDDCPMCRQLSKAVREADGEVKAAHRRLMKARNYLDRDSANSELLAREAAASDARDWLCRHKETHSASKASQSDTLAPIHSSGEEPFDLESFRKGLELRRQELDHANKERENIQKEIKEITDNIWRDRR